MASTLDQFTLTDRTAMIRRRPGKRKIQGNVSAEGVPSWISVPSETSGGLIPKPR